MIQSLDPVGPGPRLEPGHLLGRGPVIDAEQARMLGLRNGQVVQAVADNSGSAFNVVWPSGLRSGLPTALQAFPLPSQWRWAAGTGHELLAVLMPGGHIMLRPVKSGAGAGVAAPAGPASPGTAQPASAASSSAYGATMGAASAYGATMGAASAYGATTGAASAAPPGPAPLAYSLGQAFAAAQAAVASQAAGGSAEVARLLQQAPAWAAFLRLVNSLSQPMGSSPTDADPGIEGQVPTGASPHPAGTAAAPLSSRLAEMLGAALPRMGSLTPEGLRLALTRAGLGTEAALLAGAAGLDQDLKVALRRLLRGPPMGIVGAEAALGRAVDDLERSQLDSLSAQMRGEVLLSLVLPFGDAGPVALRISRERQRPGEEPPPFVVDVHSTHSGLGPLWLRTQVAHDNSRVALAMWAQRPEVAEQARQRAQELRQSLTANGLVLAALDIVSGAPPSDDGVFARPSAGA